jgi:BirA family biotin operon repressor/biotin-[acetyl-CoA-carboxylase] ligase
MNDKLLAVFHDHQGEFISGVYLSQILGISRTAIWKRIHRLKTSGYHIESIPKLGYKLIDGPKLLKIEELIQCSKDSVFSNTFHYYEVVESTQTVAHEALLSGSVEGTVIVAERQLAGKGRRGRQWLSLPYKGIYMSFLIFPQVSLVVAPQMTLLIAVALCRTIRIELGIQATIKWPNDILIAGRKVSGILVDTLAEADSVKSMIAGVGINVNHNKEDFVDDLQSKATSLKMAIGQEVSREKIICEFFKQFKSLYTVYSIEGFSPILRLWEALTSSLYRDVSVNAPHGEIHGFAEGITESGALLVKDHSGVLHTLYSGDLT